jgi:1,4-dihydroxy-2-naphthoate octaprenyltransferase
LNRNEPRRPKPVRPKRSRDDDDERGGYSRVYVSPAVITGVLMMVGAAVWFFGALALGVIFIYPPILFVLGLVAVVKGFLGHEED